MEGMSSAPFLNIPARHVISFRVRLSSSSYTTSNTLATFTLLSFHYKKSCEGSLIYNSVRIWFAAYYTSLTATTLIPLLRYTRALPLHSARYK